MTTKTITSQIKDDKGNGPNDIGGSGGNGQSSVSPSGQVVNKALLGLLAFIGTEVMFFGGLISSFLILRAGSEIWPPVAQPRLPVAVTGVNTFFLLFSGFTMSLALRAVRREHLSALMKWLYVTAVLGGIFLTFQGYEWLRLVNYGLTFSSSVYGGTFYALIGCHGLHVFGAMISLLIVLRNTHLKKYSSRERTGVVLCGVYWYFVVGIWPVLYILVYLN